MQWSTSTGHLARSRAGELGMAELLEGYLE